MQLENKFHLGNLMDDLDKKIIELLQEDGGTPLTKIAEILGVPKPTVYLRFNKMKEQGVILGFNVVLGNGDSDKHAVLLKTKDYLISDMSNRNVSNLGEKLAKRGDVVFAAKVSKNEIIVVWNGNSFDPSVYEEVNEIVPLPSMIFKSP